MKKIIKISLLLIMSMVLITGCNSKKSEGTKPNENFPEEETKINTNKGVIEEKQVETLKLNNTSLIYEKGTSTLTTTITNIGEEEIYVHELKIHVIKNEEEIVELIGYVGSKIQPNGTKVLKTKYGSDITDATRIEYEIVRLR